MTRLLFLFLSLSICAGFKPFHNVNLLGKLKSFNLNPSRPTSSAATSSSTDKINFKVLSFLAIQTLSLFIIPSIALARPEGVNKPELLPTEFTTVIDTANFLSKSQEKKARASIEELEKKTNFKLRVLCQAYPNTPGLAIKDYWKVDDNTVVAVFDKGEGFNRKGIPSNMINLNIGKNVEDVLPNQFWSRLSNKLGNTPMVKQIGEDAVVLNTVEAITFCLETKECRDLPFEL